MEPLHQLVVVGMGGTQGIVHLLGQRHRRLRRDFFLGMMLVEIGMTPTGNAKVLLNIGEDRERFGVFEFLGVCPHPLHMPLDPLDVVAERVARIACNLCIDGPMGCDLCVVIDDSWRARNHLRGGSRRSDDGHRRGWHRGGSRGVGGHRDPMRVMEVALVAFDV